MMTTIMVLMAQLVSAMWCYYNKGPMKLSITLFILSSFMFYWFSFCTSMTLMSMIMYLMFMGGILMAFMIISAISPSAIMSKTKKIMTSMMLFSIMLVLMTSNLKFNFKISESLMYFKNMNIFMPMVLSMIMILLIYFFCMMSMISSSKSGLRTFSWCR